MKTADIKQKIEQFTNGLDADCIVMVTRRTATGFMLVLTAMRQSLSL